MNYLIRRVKDEALHIIITGQTVRQTAIVFNVSKSTIHKDITERLKEIDDILYKKVRRVLDKNLSERHIRGGNATKELYKKIKNK